MNTLLPTEAARPFISSQFRVSRLQTQSSRGLRLNPAPSGPRRVACRISPPPERLRPAPEAQPSQAQSVPPKPAQPSEATQRLVADLKSSEVLVPNGKVVKEKSHHVSMVVQMQNEDSDGEDAITCDRQNEFPMLILMRHGESMWNDLKLFTGDVDIPLTERGVKEALAGGKAVSDVDFDMVFTSRLIRSKQTALLAMTQNAHKSVPVIVRGGYYGRGKTGDENRLRLREAASQALRQAACRMIPVYADPALNERCYGDLQGLNKEAAAKEFGHEMVAKWRRSHDTRPPKGESLLDTWERALAFFQSTVVPRLSEGKNVLVVAHGNVLRCLIAHICDLTELEMLRLHVATAQPYSFAFDKETESYAQCCSLPPIDPDTNKPKHTISHGLVSVLRNEADSLI